MADIQGLSDILQKLAYVQSGGLENENKKENAQALFSGMSSLANSAVNMQKIRSDAVEQAINKKKLQIADQNNQMETEKFNQEYGPFGKSKVTGTAGVGDQIQGNTEKPLSLFQQTKLADISKKQAETSNKLNPYSGDTRGAISSGYASREFIKSIFPDISENEDVSIGQLKQQIQLNRQSSLEGERTDRRNQRISERQSDLISKFNSDPSVKKSQQSIDAANTIKQLAESGNPIAAASIPTYSARMSGEVGNLSEADKRPFGGSRAILNRMDAAFSEMSNGTLSEDNKKFILELTNIINSKAKQNINNIAKLRAKQYSKVGIYGDENQIYSTLSPEDIANESIIKQFSPGQSGVTKSGIKFTVESQ